MKVIDMVRFIRYSMLVLLLIAITAFTIFAQANANGNTRTDRDNDRPTQTRTVERDDGFDWGWLGLLGLLGLAGLIPKRRKVEVQEFHDANRPTSGTGAAR
ncbi:MAG: WGxxGxxG-CTERM domain-containing protein [Acidobacteriota bacterium]|nr:WGxxGxxG-CTERM domain-containing protein [Acidobacteriota bacterium]